MANRFRISVSEMTPVRRPERWAPGIAAAGTEAEGEMTDADAGTGEAGSEDWLVLLPPLLLPFPLPLLLPFPVPAVIIVADTAGEAVPLLLLLALVIVVVVGPEMLCMAAAVPPPLSVVVVAPTGPSNGVAGALGLGLALSTTHIL